MESITQSAALAIEKEIAWFESVVDVGLTLYFKNESQYQSIFELLPPDTTELISPYSALVNEMNLGYEERLVLILALIPHVRPQSLDVFLIKNQNVDAEFSEFGGRKSTTKNGFIPTLETASFILAGADLQRRFNFVKQFDKNHPFFARGILDFDTEQEFGLQQELKISNEYLGYITTGIKQLPQYSSKFPA